MCSEVEIFLFVFFELCLGSYGEPMLTGLYCNVVYLSLSSSLFIYICIHWFLFLFVISVYIVFLLANVNISLLFWYLCMYIGIYVCLFGKCEFLLLLCISLFLFIYFMLGKFV